MGGRFSQQKGKRSELGLCTHLRYLNYTEVSRIPHWLKGEHNQDVWATCPKTGNRTTFENKSMAKLPTWLRKLFQKGQLGTLRMAFGQDLVAFGTNPLALQELHDCVFEHCDNLKIRGSFKALQKKVGGADFLVVKGNRTSWLYMKFFGPWE